MPAIGESTTAVTTLGGLGSDKLQTSFGDATFATNNPSNSFGGTSALVDGPRRVATRSITTSARAPTASSTVTVLHEQEPERPRPSNHVASQKSASTIPTREGTSTKQLRESRANADDAAEKIVSTAPNGRSLGLCDTLKETKTEASTLDEIRSLATDTLWSQRYFQRLINPNPNLTLTYTLKLIALFLGYWHLKVCRRNS